MNSKLPNIIQEKIEKIRLDNTSGSTELAKQASEIFIFLVDNVSVTYSSKLISLIQETAYKLIKAQPTMASIVNLANTTLIDALSLIGNVTKADMVTDWNERDQTTNGLINLTVPWSPYIGINFSIQIEQGYEVSVTAAGTWDQI